MRKSRNEIQQACKLLKGFSSNWLRLTSATRPQVILDDYIISSLWTQSSPRIFCPHFLVTYLVGGFNPSEKY